MGDASVGPARRRPARPSRAGVGPARHVARYLAGYVAGCLAIVAVAGCGARDAAPATPVLATSTPSRMDTYDWLASNSGPSGCPMEIVGGDFFFPAGAGSLYIPRATVHEGWGRDVSQHVVGDDRKPVPDRVSVEFFSFLENKFYRGEFPLPRDSIARLFRDGYERVGRPGGRGTYDALVVGVAPGGAVAVWASGGERQTEVFFGQAQPADIDFHRAFDAPDTMDRQRFVADELAEAAKSDSLVRVMAERVPVGRWAAYRTRYPWRPVFDRMGEPDRLGSIHYLNGEREALRLPLDGNAARATRPVPRVVTFADPRTRRAYEVTFGEEETLAAFGRAAAGGEAVDLVFAPHPDGSLQVAVRGAAARVDLREVRVQTVGGR